MSKIVQLNRFIAPCLFDPCPFGRVDGAAGSSRQRVIQSSTVLPKLQSFPQQQFFNQLFHRSFRINPVPNNLSSKLDKLIEQNAKLIASNQEFIELSKKSRNEIPRDQDVIDPSKKSGCGIAGAIVGGIIVGGVGMFIGFATAVAEMLRR